MERMQEILQRLNMGNGSDVNFDPGELERLKVDSFNRSEGYLNLEDGYNCDICHNKGLIMNARQINGHWTTTASECKCRNIRKTIYRMKRSGLKDIIKDYTFQKFEAVDDWQKTIKDAAVSYSQNPDGWFFIGGQSGAGKTHICTAICREFLLAGRAVRYMLWRDDVVKIKNVVNDMEQYEAIINEFKTVEVLYIDDLFKTGKGADGVQQKPTAADINAAFEILNYRYNSPSLLTIISSECTINDILDIDEAVGGRIFEKAKKAFSLKPDRKRNYRLKGCVEL